MLTKDPLMSFRIEVAADSMVQADEDQEKKDRMEFLTAAGGFIKQAGEAVSAEPKLTPLVLDMLKFGITAFKIGRTMEGEFDKVADEMKAAAAQPQPPKPDPAMMKVQQDGQLAQSQMQLDQAKMQQEAQASQMRLQMEQQRDQQSMQLKAQTDQMKLQQESQLAQQQQAHEQFMEQSKQQFEQWKVEFETAAKVTIAQIAAKTTMDSALISAENAANTETSQDLSGDTEVESNKLDQLGKISDIQNQTLQAIQSMAEAITKPKTVVRGKDGRITGVQ
jgi:hypothetical protein